jgi:hypothetical protein
MPSLYKLYYTNIVFTEKTTLTLSMSCSGTHTNPTGNRLGQRKPLVEIFIEEVHIISSY